ncbi:MAG: hypothetical protein NC204_00105 [Candidatus Amulumruptor caecigallinarius]|nr:hypothetical protein [Candidatus Amulumruptor caecigallinarius]
MISRVVLSDKNSRIFDMLASPGGSEGPAEPSTPNLPDSGEISNFRAKAAFSIPDAGLFPKPGISFSLTPALLQDYESARYSFPAIDIAVSVPEDDLPRVRSWIHGTSATNLPELSETLRKRLTTAIIGALESFWNRATAENLLHAPLKLGWAYLLQNDTTLRLAEPSLMVPNDMAPLIASRELELQSSTLKSVVEFRQHAFSLTVNIPALNLPAEVRNVIKGICIYSTREASLLSGDETITGIRTYSAEDEMLRIWAYSRKRSDTVIREAGTDTTFRILTTIPVEELETGHPAMGLPQGDVSLTMWQSLPKLPKEYEETSSGGSGDTGGGSSSGNTGDENDDEKLPEYLLLRTEPLDFGLPEIEKRVRRVMLRGIFSRNPQYMRITLYGSHHREKWRRVARASGWCISGVRGVRYRWWRVEIEARTRPGDKFEAITFEYVSDL